MIHVDLRSNLKKVSADFRALTENIKEKATVRALNRALDQSATAANREIRKVYNLKVAVVAKAFKKKYAREKMVYPVAVLEVSGSRIGLIEFDAKQVRRGVSVRVRRGGRRKTRKGAFIATTRSGYTGVFERRGRERYPIKNLKSITLPRAFTNAAVIKAVKQVARESIVKNFKQQLQFLGSRHGR